jgi:hypothetical protein
MKRNRYDLNDRNAYDGRPVRKPAKSPRTTPARRSVTSGTGGQYVSGGANQTATVGQAGAGGNARRPATNTMAKSKHGGMPITYYAPMERWQPTTARTAVHAPARTAGKHYDPATREDDGSASVAEGIRQAAMARHSILRTNGAIDVLPRVGPVWSDDTN